MKFRPTALAVAAVLLLASCGAASSGSGSSSSSSDQILTIAITAENPHIDPMLADSQDWKEFLSYIAQPLVHVGTGGKVQGVLATSWSQSNGGRTWTLTLRKGVRFTDGTPFNAAAAEASLDRTRDPKVACSQCGTLNMDISSITTLRTGQLQINLKDPMGATVFLGQLSTEAYAILSPKTIRKGTPGYADQEKPIGTGPYLLSSRVIGQQTVLERNASYWGDKPYYKEQVLKIVPEAVTREALLRSGQAQVIEQPPIQDLSSLKRDSSVRVLVAPGTREIVYALMTAGHTQPLLRNPKVRQALNYAVNKSQIVKTSLYGTGTVSTSPVAPSVFGYCNIGTYQYNPAKARHLLREAGATGMTLKLVTPSGRYTSDVQTANDVAGYLRAVGVNVKGPSTADWPTYLSMILEPPDTSTIDGAMIGFEADYPDAFPQLQNYLTSEIAPNGGNIFAFSDATVDSQIDTGSGAGSDAVRSKAYCQAQQAIWQQAPAIWLWQLNTIAAYSSKVTGISGTPDDGLRTLTAHAAS